MLLHRLDAPLGHRFQYNPMGRRHAALMQQRVTGAEVKAALQTVVEVVQSTTVTACLAEPTVQTTTQLRPTTVLRGARLALGAAVRQVTPALAPAFCGIDAVFGHAQGAHGAHLHGLLPQAGWLPYGVGVGVGAAVGGVMGLLALPAFADDAQPGAWMTRCVGMGAAVGACVGGLPRWAWCQASAAVGLGIKVLCVAVGVALLLAVRAAQSLRRRPEPKPDSFATLACQAIQASVGMSPQPALRLDTVIAAAPLAEAALVAGARAITPWRGWMTAACLAGLYIGVERMRLAVPG